MLTALTLLFACNLDPRLDGTNVVEQVGYRFPADDEGPSSGERGNVSISEVLWAGSVDNDGNHDPSDVFLEIRNQGSLPVNLSRWQIVIRGSVTRTIVLPNIDRVLNVGDHAFLAAKNDGCFPNPDFVTPTLAFGEGDPFSVRITDADERLIDDAGSRTAPPFAGGWDRQRSRSMERVQLMFSGGGYEPQVWHFYTPLEADVPNNDKVAERCRSRTLASPGRANSPDYSGAFAAGSAD